MRLALLLLVLAALLSWARFAIGDVELLAREAHINSAIRQPRAAKARIPVRESGESTNISAGPPLFRPAQAPPDPNAPRAGETFALVGIVMREERRTAFLRDAVDGRNWTASAGGEVAGWSVEQITERCVALRRRRQTQQMCL